MSQLQNTYDIQRPTGVCAATGHELAPGETVYAALVDPPADDRSEEQRKANDKGELPMLRIDVSADAWEDNAFRPPYLFGFWRTEVPEPNEKKKLLVGDAAIQELMLSMEDATEDKQLAFRYVLALILLRKKLLRHDGIDRREQDDGPVQDHWQFTPKLDIGKGHFGKWNEDNKFEVLDPHITEDEISGVTEQLSQVLELDL
ncbi:MAG: hypothetical protein KTR15_06120 [Phycisphaeraceae bacterium]|nr:hypothetical protein [Phycisphaeraceae bacterium]